MSALVNLAQRRFGRLLVLRRNGTQCSHAMWECLCDCGQLATVMRGALLSGNTRSCGCLKSELDKIKLRTHGMTNTPEYNVWRTMIQRCTNPKNKDYRYYGGRGIRICQKWRKSFAAFLSDMGNRPFPKAEIDRKNNDGNYEPNNCRWVDDYIQANNRRGK